MHPNRKPGFFDYGGKLWSWCQSLLALILMNLLFLVGCIPVLTIGVSVLALTEVSIDRIRYGGEVFPVFREFWQAYKRHLGRGIALSAALILIFGSLFLDYLWIASGTTLFRGLVGLLGAITVILSMILVYYVPLLSSGSYRLWDGLIEAFFYSFSHWPRSLPSALALVALVALCLLIPNLYLALLPILVIIGFALISLALSAIVQDTLPDAENEDDYEEEAQ